MIDNFALGLTHVLMLIAAIILLRRRDLDSETATASEPDGSSSLSPQARPGKSGQRDA
ncbi:hypothetical protein ABTO96_19190 [Acinetobacter baumannii]